MRQMTLLTESARQRGFSAEQLGAFFRVRLGVPVRLVLTNNRSTMLSYRQEGMGVHLRLHRLFLAAPAHVIEAVAVYVGEHDPHAGRVIDAHIEANRPKALAPATPVRTRGRVHDLQAIFERQNATFFHGRVRSQVTWGAQRRQRRARRSIQLGCYVQEESLIRIHPCLDQPFVPEFYVTWVMFHEMLHEVFGVERHGSRRSVHPPEFVALEETHPDFLRAKAWESQHLGRLLSYRGP